MNSRQYFIYYWPSSESRDSHPFGIYELEIEMLRARDLRSLELELHTPLNDSMWGYSAVQY